MTFEKKYQNLSKNDNNDSEIALQIIKKNLKKRKFETQTQMVSFLKSNGIYISQATLSRILSENNIVKGDAGLYEDTIERIKSSRLSEIMNRSNTFVNRPMVYGFTANEEKDRKIYFLFLKLDIGFENFLYEVLSDYLGKNTFSYSVGHGCIQVYHKNLAVLNRIYNELYLIKKGNK